MNNMDRSGQTTSAHTCRINVWMQTKRERVGGGRRKSVNLTPSQIRTPLSGSPFTLGESPFNRGRERSSLLLCWRPGLLVPLLLHFLSAPACRLFIRLIWQGEELWIFLCLQFALRPLTLPRYLSSYGLLNSKDACIIYSSCISRRITIEEGLWLIGKTGRGSKQRE